MVSNMKPLARPKLLATALFGSLVGISVPASAAPCTDLPNVTIGLGTNQSLPLFARFSAALAALPEPVSLVVQGSTSCYGITAYIDDTLLTGTASFWDVDGVEQSCELPLTGIAPDYGLIAIDPLLCDGVMEIPAGLGERKGPVSAYNLIVPVASSQTSISAEAVYFVYGFGAMDGMVSPWTLDAELYARNQTAATQIAVALGAGIPVGKFKGIDTMTVTGMVSAVAMSQNPEAALGFAGSEVVDLNRDVVRTLAFQAYGQTCGYWPDSTVNTFDKRNVRDGHYYLWTNYRVFTPVDGDGEITHEPTRIAMGYLTGTETVPTEFPALDLVIEGGSIPQCAMQVGRDEDIGPLYSVAPEEPCGCYFEFRATGESSCEACVATEDCDEDTAVCRNGFCEGY
jgi:hypothetical protein